MKPRAASVTIVLFGATGDLAVKKLFPALDALLHEGALPASVSIIAVSRRNWDTEAFSNFLKEAAPSLSEELHQHLTYKEVEFEGRTGYTELADFLETHQTEETLIYLSLAPHLFTPVIEDLRDANILQRGSTKLLLEKPFGTSVDSAKALHALLVSCMDEPQIYPVDHYLGKSTVHAIMDAHETSTNLRRILSNKTMDSVTVELLETKGIDGRATYDQVGAFRDVGQNHMLLMLAVLLAEYPKTENPNAWQEARALVLEQLANTATVSRGQYEGYQTERGVASDSKTETAFSITTTFKEGELAGVPVTLSSGKRMKRAYAGIEVIFKPLPKYPRSIRFEIQPEPHILITHEDHSTKIPVSQSRDAYANVLFDALQGERKHFAGMREILAAWQFTDALITSWQDTPLVIYK